MADSQDSPCHWGVHSPGKAWCTYLNITSDLELPVFHSLSVVLSCFSSHTFAFQFISFPIYSHSGFPIPPKIIVDKTQSLLALSDEKKINAFTCRISKLLVSPKYSKYKPISSVVNLWSSNISDVLLDVILLNFSRSQVIESSIHKFATVRWKQGGSIFYVNVKRHSSGQQHDPGPWTEGPGDSHLVLWVSISVSTHSACLEWSIWPCILFLLISVERTHRLDEVDFDSD